VPAGGAHFSFEQQSGGSIPKEISAKLPAIVAAGRQNAAFPNDITDAALCRGAATPVLRRIPLGFLDGAFNPASNLAAPQRAFIPGCTAAQGSPSRISASDHLMQHRRCVIFSALPFLKSCLA